MDIEAIQKQVETWIEDIRSGGTSPEYAPQILQCRLLLSLYGKLSDIESYLKSTDNEIWVRGTGKE